MHTTEAARPEPARHGRYSSKAGVAGAKRKDEQLALAGEVADQGCGKTDEDLDGADSDYACRVRFLGTGRQPRPSREISCRPLWLGALACSSLARTACERGRSTTPCCRRDTGHTRSRQSRRCMLQPHTVSRCSGTSMLCLPFLAVD